MKMEKKIRIYSAVMTSLFVLSAVTGTYYWKVSADRAAVNMDLGKEKETLLVEKGILSAQLESLHQTFEAAKAENSELRGTISKNELTLSEKDNQLNKLKKQSTKDRLTIDDLRRENTELANRISDLNVVAQNTKLPGGMRTSAFRVEVEKRNDKLTVKSKKAKELVISFDMMDVPSDMQGVQKLFLAISDNKGTPVKSKDATPVKVGTEDDAKEVVIHQSKEINLTQGQRLSFNYQLDDKLKPGTYRAAIYTKEGWIGSVSFRVS